MNTVELSQKWVLTYFKFQEPEFYARLFNDYEGGPFEATKVCTMVIVIINILPGDPKLYVFKDRKSSGVFCSFSSVFFFVGDKVAADILKMISFPHLKKSLRFSLDVALHNVR